MKQLLRYKKGLKLVFFDFETESLTLNFDCGNRPWQLGMLKCQDKEEVEFKDLYVKWEKPINVSKDAARITGFDQKDYDKRALPENEVFEVMLDWFNWADHIIAHNILNFDIPLAKEWYLKYNKDWKPLLPKCIDTKCLAQAIKSGIPFDIQNDDFLTWQIALSTYHERGVKTNLAQMAKDFDIDFDKSLLHNALEDIRLNKKVFESMIWNIEI